MNKLSLSLLFAGMLFTVQSQAQNQYDALTMGRYSSGTTARSIGLGGTGGAMGADFSSLTINPAGIGVYRNSEITLTPSLRLNNATGSYLGNSETDNFTKFNVSNFGLIFTSAAKGEAYNQKDWKAFSIGIGYNRLADFNANLQYAGSNTEHSLTDLMSEDAIANGIGENIVPPLGFFGWEGFLLDDNYQSIPRDAVLNSGGSLLQRKFIENRGGIGEWSFSLGGNYKEKLMLGLSLSLVDYKLDRYTRFDEDDETGDLDNDFNYLTYSEMLTTEGIGFNAKLGAIYVVNEQFRLGAAFHTPTWAAFNDLVDYALATNTEQLKSRTGNGLDPLTVLQPTDPYTFSYSYTSPWKAVLGATVLLGRSGIISADYELTDYNSMRFNMGEGYEDYAAVVNNAIRETYTMGHTIRLGVEGRKDFFSGRLGFAYHSSPYEQADIMKGSVMDFSAGLGARFGAFFTDLGYRYRMMEYGDRVYPLGSATIGNPVGLFKTGNSLLALTLGYKF